MKAKALVFCTVGGCWVLACGSEPPPDEPPETSAPEDEVVVIATAEAVTSAATAAASGTGGAASAGTNSTSTADPSDEETSSTGSSSGGATSTTSDGAASNASTMGAPGTAGSAGATDASNGGAAAGTDAGSGTTTGESGSDTASTSAGSSGAAGGAAGGGSAGETNTTGEPLPPPLVPLGAVLITEYVEGGDNKAVEISNVSDEPVFLNECRLETYFNGNLESTSGVDLEIELWPQTSYVLCKATGSSTLFSICDRAAGSINFNGDDALVLRCNDVVHDSFGQLGFDPGEAWRSTPSTGDGASPAYGTADYVLRRRCGALPRTDPTSAFENALSEDWVAVWDFEEALDPEFAGLGIAACAEGSDPGSSGGAGAAASD